MNINKTRLCIALFAFLIFLHPLMAETGSSLQQIYLNPKFADQLFAEEDYQRAADEYQRVYFYHSQLDPQSSILDSLLYLSALSYRRLSNYDKSNLILERIPDRQNYIYASAQVLSAANYFNLRDYPHSKEHTQKASFSAQDQIQNRYKQLRLLNYLATEDYAEAKSFMSSIGTEDSLRFLPIFNISHTKKRKSPFFAATLSTIVPGSGKIYTDRSLDGLYSFVIVLFSGYRAINDYNSKGIESISTWIFGSMAAYFYVGNIYGSAISAKLYNDHNTEEYKRKLEQLVNDAN